MQLCSFFGRQLVVDHDDLDLGTVRQVGWLVHNEAAVLHLDLQCLHRLTVPLPSLGAERSRDRRPDAHRACLEESGKCSSRNDGSIGSTPAASTISHQAIAQLLLAIPRDRSANQNRVTVQSCAGVLADALITAPSLVAAS